MLVEGGHKAANLQRAEQRIVEAARNGAQGQLWLDSYRPVARDFHLWIAGVSNVGPITAGPWQGRQCIGCSLLVGPDGQQVLMGPYGAQAEALLFADLQLLPRPTRGDGWETL